MAEEIKSFVLYTEYEKHFALLDDAEKGRLIMALFEYVKNGVVPKLDGATNMAFSFISAQLARDKEKWENIQDKRREAGRLGGQAKAKQTEANQANANFAKQTEANQAVNVDVDVNVNDNVDDNIDVNNKEGEEIKEKI